MASSILVNVYQINNNAFTTPLAMGFPTGISLFRPATGQLVGSTYLYGRIQLSPAGDQYLVVETVAQLVALANA